VLYGRAGAAEGQKTSHLREIMEIVLNAFRTLRFLALTLSVAALGCHAQTAAQKASQTTAVEASEKLSPELARRVEVMIRSRSEVPPEYVISISDRKKSEFAGYDQISVTFASGGNVSRPLTFLLSTDGKTLAQLSKFDLSQDPKDKVSAVGRPSRGGPENAPVVVVGFDDLECPYCAKMHAAMFPAILDRYKNQVRVVYIDFPLIDIHPWAMRAAIDANCVAAVSPAGYWNYVDYVHAHSAEIGGDDHKVEKANDELDKLARDEGARQKVNEADLAACLKKQDDTKIKASMKVGDALGLGGTPATYVNGERLDGVVPMDIVFRAIDGALIAAGQTPPPAPAQPVATPPAQPATKPGN
jgi:protein-disulfide isomerase